MTRNQRLRRTMRNPVRQHRRSRNRVNRRARQKEREEFAAWMQDRLWQQQIIRDELIALQVHRATLPIVVTGF